MQAIQLMSASKYLGETKYNEPMAHHTSWRAGGSAARYCKPVDIADLTVLLHSLPVDEELLWIGLGSNTLVRDGGFRGTVIATQGVMSRLERDGGHVIVGAGVTCAKLAKFCVREKLTGGEFFAGIPGLIGGALAMNAGAFGGETWRQVLAVETINRRGEINRRQVDEYQVAYRSVVGPEEEWFISATMKFDSGDPEQVTKDIKRLLAKRAEQQPTGSASCGSVFRNPDDDHAAHLIEKCGLKGERIGGAVISEKHANFIINDGNANANDIEALIKYIQETVDQKFGVRLQTEVIIVGDRS